MTMGKTSTSPLRRSCRPPPFAESKPPPTTTKTPDRSGEDDNPRAFMPLPIAVAPNGASTVLTSDFSARDATNWRFTGGTNNKRTASNRDVGMGNPEGLSSDSEFESESEEEDQDQVVKLAEPSKKATYNKDGLLDKLGDISWPDNAGWVHRLSIDIDQDGEVDVNDDLARELSFYTQALQGAREAYLKFQSDGIPFLRPADYYAEMVKTDNHMEKVKGRLLAEKKKIEEAEERKKARENKKLAKEVQVQKTKERAMQKKQEFESVKKWRKQRQQSGFDKNSNAELDLDFEDGKAFQRLNKKRPGVLPGDRSGGKGGRPGGFNNKKGYDKRPKGKEIRNSKFGFGGKKGLKKQNTADSTNDFRGFKNKKDNKNDFSNKKRRVK